MIEVDSLSFAYGAQSVLDSVSFKANDGQLLAVLGANGAGKTTLFKCILGMLRGHAGSVSIDGANADRISARELAHRVAYIPQTHGQVFAYSVLDMVLMGTSHALSPLSVPGGKEAAMAHEALVRVGIEKLSGKSFSRISGGEQQLVLIARALAQHARNLIMDEPVSSLDYGNQARVLSVVRALADDGYTVLLSTHNPQHAFWYADTALALHDGQVAAFGRPAETIDAALIKKLYCMDASIMNTPDGMLIVPALRTGMKCEKEAEPHNV